MVNCGDLIGPIEVVGVAHGGHVVGRFSGRVVFIRHGLPGEILTVRLTDVSKKNFWRADAVEILQASPNRVDPPCPVAAICGGCDFQHVSLPGQRDLKRQVICEQLDRLAGINWQGQVEQVNPTHNWRTRMKYRMDGEKVGLLASRSHQIVDLPPSGCLIADSAGLTVSELKSFGKRYGQGQLQVVCAKSGVSVLVNGKAISGSETVVEQVCGRDYQVRANGFWQIHRNAGQTLVNSVLTRLKPEPGQSALDLYCGVGLFAGGLASRGAEVTGIETSKQAIALARKNVPEAKFFAQPVEKSLSKLPKTDLLVLDPPRSGAGQKVSRALARLGPKKVAYVACDPAGLARDLKCWLEAGYRIDIIEAFDLFPMTSHVETICFMSR